MRALAVASLASAALWFSLCGRERPAARRTAEEVAPARPAAPPARPLDRELASRLVALSLDCTARQWPNKPSHVYDEPGQLQPPAALTPAFFGCLDWHSAVHGHWAMLRVLGLYPDLPEAAAMRERLAQHLTAQRIAGELAFFRAERNRTFERPYGWGWLLRLYAELGRHPEPAARQWQAALQPLAEHLAGATIDYLGRLSTPVRAGTHYNTAFALAHMLDAARVTGMQPLAAAIDSSARRFFAADRDCPTAYEPSGEDFLSPCLAEADLMRRILPPPEFAAWLDRFLPPVDAERFAPLRTPVSVRDRHDPKIGHLIGLAFHRAWCFEGIASALPGPDARRASYRNLAALHRQAGLAQMFDAGYGGSHWLASFAIYLLTGAGAAP
jgi:hypothetical protein